MQNVTDVISFSKAGKHDSLLKIRASNVSLSLCINHMQALTIFRFFGKVTRAWKTSLFVFKMKRS